jgi:hypothetical protein
MNSPRPRSGMPARRSAGPAGCAGAPSRGRAAGAGPPPPGPPGTPRRPAWWDAARTGRTARRPGGRGPGRPCSRRWPPATPGARPEAGISSVSAAVAVPVIRPADSPETTRASDEHADAGSQDEQDRAQRAGREGHGHDRPAPGLVRRPSGQQQGNEHRRGVDGERHRHRGRGEMPAALVDDVQRGRQGGAEHGDAQHQRQQPECRPAAGRPALSDWPVTAGWRRPGLSARERAWWSCPVPSGSVDGVASASRPSG